MSFGYSVGDAVLLTQLAWHTVQGARKACGEHDELTREASSLHKVLQRLQHEVENPESPVNRADEDRRRELGEHVADCERILRVMDEVLTKYNALSEDKRSGKKLWQKIRFGNGEMKDLAEIRLKFATHTSAILMSLNLCSLGSQGRVEAQLSSQSGELRGIRESVNYITAMLTATSQDGTAWTFYTNDDKAFWRELRRGLNREGFSSATLHKHKQLINAYVKELGERGVFDEQESHDRSDTPASEGETQELYDPTSEDEALKLDVRVLENETQESDTQVFEARDPMAVQTAFENRRYMSPELDDHSSNSEIYLDHSLASSRSASPRVSSSSQIRGIENLAPTVSEGSPSPHAAVHFPVQIEEVVDEDFVPGAHPNVDVHLTPEPGLPDAEKDLRDYTDRSYSFCTPRPPIDGQKSEVPYTREQDIPQLQERSISPVVPSSEPDLSSEQVEAPENLEGASSNPKVYLHPCRRWEPGYFNAFMIYNKGVWLQSGQFDDRSVFAIPLCSEADSNDGPQTPSENDYGEYSDADCSDAWWSADANCEFERLIDLTEYKRPVWQKRRIHHWSMGHNACHNNDFDVVMSKHIEAVHENVAETAMITSTHPHDESALDFPPQRPKSYWIKEFVEEWLSDVHDVLEVETPSL